MKVPRRLNSLLAVALALASAPALAQGTQAQRAACTPDVWRLCASHIPSVPAITGCLRREEARLSPACRTAMHEAATPRVARAEPGPRRVAPAPRRVVLAERAGRRPMLVGPRARVAGRFPVRAAPRYAVRPTRYAAPHHRPRYAGRGGFGGGGMRQAQYWLDRLGGMGGLAGLAGYGGSLAGIRQMRVGDIMDMMQ